MIKTFKYLINFLLMLKHKMEEVNLSNSRLDIKFAYVGSNEIQIITKLSRKICMSIAFTKEVKCLSVFKVLFLRMIKIQGEREKENLKLKSD